VRKLASIQRITAIDPIPDADAIECASVLGWKVVVKKGEFQVGDLAVYMEIDSVPPDEEPYRFLWRNTEMRPNNFRIRTVKLRGQISQGILFPLEKSWMSPESGGWVNGTEWVEEGTDVTEMLGVTKYEPPLPGGEVEGQFFDGVPKTDEDRVQSRHDLLEALWGRPYYITVKCDGASMTIAMHEDKVKVASRNYRLAYDPNSPYWRAAENSELMKMIAEFPWLAVQGELVGPGIQGNKLGLQEPTCLVFNIYDRMMGRYLSWDEMRSLQRDWDFQMVPFVEQGVEFMYSQAELLELAEGKYDGTKNEREGIVIRSKGILDRVSFKAISNRFLLKGGD
jgi:RNA ligase (TIGR02306 family)